MLWRHTNGPIITIIIIINIVPPTNINRYPKGFWSISFFGAGCPSITILTASKY